MVPKLPLIILVTALFSSTAHANILITNPSFEANTNSGVGYGPITGWTTTGTGFGVSTQAQPFLNQPAYNGNNVAFLQQGGATISQTLTGFDPNKTYTVTYFVSERGFGTSPSTNTTVSLNGGVTSFTSGTIVKTNKFRRITSGPLTVTGSSSALSITSANGPGDDSLLMDSVSITRATPLVIDGGFENPILTGTGNAGRNLTITGSPWNFGTNSGITNNNSDFVPPAAPEGSQAAILRGTQDITQTIHGFETGVTYSLSFETAGRTSTLGPTEFRVLVGSNILTFNTNSIINPGQNGYQSYTSDPFTTLGGSFLLTFDGLTPGDKTTYLDDVRFNFVAEAIPEPNTTTLVILTAIGLLLQRRTRKHTNP